jgi:hypothetical protein
MSVDGEATAYNVEIRGLTYLPNQFRLLIILLSAVSLTELGHETIERLYWGAIAARKQSK